MLFLDPQHINSHLGIYGDIGGGKSLLISAYLREVERRGDVAIIWDPDREYARKFRKVERGDFVLDATCNETPFWAINQEYDGEGEAMALSACFFPENPAVKDPFWNNSARGLLTLLSALHHPTVADLGFWCADDSIIDEKVRGTEYERILTNNAPGLRSSIISHLNQIAMPLRAMPSHPEGRRVFTVRDWCEHRRGWVFITSKPSHMELMKPLHQFFLSSFIQRLIAMGKRPDLPTVHLIFDEASSVTVNEFHLALIRIRKTGNPVVFAIQNHSDMKATWAERAETISSQPFYKVFFRLGSDESAKRASATVGQKRVRRVRMTFSKGKGGWQKSFQMDEEDRPVVPEWVLQNLPPRTGCVISPGKIAWFKLPIIEMPDRLPALEDRVIPEMIRRLPVQIPLDNATVEEVGVEDDDDPGPMVLMLGAGHF